MTDVLLRYLFRAAAIVVPLATLIAYFAFGADVALGVVIGAMLALADGVGLVYLVGELLAPKAKSNKAFLFLLLFGKLAIVGGILWAALSVWNVSGLGLILGIGVALGAVVTGLNRGSSSDAGQRAMAEEEARIRQEVGDNNSDPR